MDGDDEDEEENAKRTGSLFPVQSGETSDSMAPRLFPSFQSASSLFPVAANTIQPELAPGWLSNPSFSETLLPNPTPVPAVAIGVSADTLTKATNESLVSSTAISFGSESVEEGHISAERRKRKRKYLKKRQRKEEEEHTNAKKMKVGRSHVLDVSKIGSLESLAIERKSAVGTWAGPDANLLKVYYFDARGDRDNLAFGSLYRLDVARFHRKQIAGFPKRADRFRQDFKSLDPEGDGLAQDDGLKTAGRYWSVKFSSFERRRNLRRLCINFGSSGTIDRRSKPVSLAEFVPLEVSSKQPDTDKKVLPDERVQNGETWHEMAVRRTKEFNQQTRERPHDESLWIAFANFQDELMQASDKKTVIQQAVDKKMAILEKALETKKDSEDIELLYLDTCKKRDEVGVLLSKWEVALSRHSASYRMWQEFLLFRRAQFSIFSVSSHRNLFAHALQALSTSRNRLLRQEAKESVYDKEFVEAEQAMVSLFVDLCRFNWQTGHHEVAIGLFQAELEYCLFSPPIPLSEREKQRLFEAFWDSGAPRIGEDGAVGWVKWLEKEEDEVQRVRATKLVSKPQLEEEQVGGWTGWSEPVKEFPNVPETSQELEDIIQIQDDVEAEAAEAAVQVAEDDVVLLQKLGLTIDSTSVAEVKDMKIWKRWSEKEVDRDREQWLPVHMKSEKTSNNLQIVEDEENQLERIILFEDLRENLFSIQTAKARCDLVCQFVEFFNGPLSKWSCSNHRSHQERLESLENCNGPLLLGSNLLNDRYKQPEHRYGILSKLVGGTSWMQESEGRAKFSRNCLLLLRDIFPHHHGLQQALLTAEDITMAGESASYSKVFASRVLAKKLLKIHRKDLALWAAYAHIESAAGNISLARKVFDTTLTSLEALPQEARLDGPILYLAYAELELAQALNEAALSGQQRALYILSSLGCGGTFVPQSSPGKLSSVQILKAQRGYREQLLKLRNSLYRGDFTEREASLISCASLFEQLSAGWEAAALVFEEGLAMSLPGRRQQSLAYELMFVRYMKMLESWKEYVKPAQVRSIALRGCVQYPYNSELTEAYVQSASKSSLNNKLRRFFDDSSVRNPSTMLWLFALSFEIGRPGAGPRIHSLFERAVECKATQHSVVLWRCYLAYELDVAFNRDAARRVYFRAIHACPWSKTLWLDGFVKLSSVLSAKELTELVEIMREKELCIRTDVYEILLEDEVS